MILEILPLRTELTPLIYNLQNNKVNDFDKKLQNDLDSYNEESVICIYLKHVNDVIIEIKVEKLRVHFMKIIVKTKLFAYSNERDYFPPYHSFIHAVNIISYNLFTFYHSYEWCVNIFDGNYKFHYEKSRDHFVSDTQKFDYNIARRKPKSVFVDNSDIDLKFEILKNELLCQVNQLLYSLHEVCNVKVVFNNDIDHHSQEIWFITKQPHLFYDPVYDKNKPYGDNLGDTIVFRLKRDLHIIDFQFTNSKDEIDKHRGTTREDSKLLFNRDMISNMWCNIFSTKKIIDHFKEHLLYIPLREDPHNHNIYLVNKFKKCMQEEITHNDH